MSTRRTPRATALLLLAAAPLAAASGYEAKYYAITKWNAGTCTGAQRSDWDNMARGWYDHLTDSGCGGNGHCGDAYTGVGEVKNGNIADSWFTDASLVIWGDDNAHLEEADAAMIAWHGNESGDVYLGSMRVNEAGSGDCTLRRDEMQLGDEDLEFLHLSSCQSMDDNQWASWWQAFDRLHQANGFHGLMFISHWRVGEYKDFGDDGYDVGIADAWLDQMYVPNISGSDDQCPVSYAVGAGAGDSTQRMNDERYDRVLSDPVGHDHHGFRYIGGCNPGAETVINSDLSQ